MKRRLLRIKATGQKAMETWRGKGEVGFALLTPESDAGTGGSCSEGEVELIRELPDQLPPFHTLPPVRGLEMVEQAREEREAGLQKKSKGGGKMWVCSCLECGWKETRFRRQRRKCMECGAGVGYVEAEVELEGGEGKDE